MKLSIEHTQDEFGEDRWFVADANGDWISGPLHTIELARDEVRRIKEINDLRREPDDAGREYPMADEVAEIRGFNEDSPESHGVGGGDPDEGWEPDWRGYDRECGPSDRVPQDGDMGYWPGEDARPSRYSG